MKKRRRLADWLLIGGLLLCAALLCLGVFLNRSAGAWVVVRVDGREVARYSLEQDGVYSLNGGTNILMIQDEWAYLSAADCPDKLCVHQGKIRYNGQCITCLPNRLTVTVIGGDTEVELQ